jgi:hypothetical protein
MLLGCMSAAEDSVNVTADACEIEPHHAVDGL